VEESTRGGYSSGLREGLEGDDTTAWSTQPRVRRARGAAPTPPEIERPQAVGSEPREPGAPPCHSLSSRIGSRTSGGRRAEAHQLARL
jgi:hypothetical protein